jgi:NADPH-dependent curcumin reductase CurA
VNRQITLAARPEGFPTETDFALVESEIPTPAAGEVLVEAHWLSVDPYMRGRMSTARSYARPTELGEPMTGQVVGQVVESHDSRFGPGDWVVGQLGWQDYAAVRGGALRKLDPDVAPVQTALHVLGATG